jgi:soluble cytochrome b562
MSSSIDEQLAKAKERVKRLEEKKLLQDAKNAIAENEDLKSQLKNNEAERLSISRDYQQVMNEVKQLFDDVQTDKFFAGNYQEAGQSFKTVKQSDVLLRLQNIINLQK